MRLLFVSVVSAMLVLSGCADSSPSTASSEGISGEARGFEVSRDVAYRASEVSLDGVDVPLRHDREIVVVFRSSDHLFVTYDHCSWGEAAFEIDGGLLHARDWEVDAMECEPSVPEIPVALDDVFDESPSVQLSEARVELSTDRVNIVLKETNEAVPNPYRSSTTVSLVESGS